MTPRRAFKGIRKCKKTLLFTTLGALWGPGGTTRVCLREVDFGLRFAPPRTSQKSRKSRCPDHFFGQIWRPRSTSDPRRILSTSDKRSEPQSTVFATPFPCFGHLPSRRGRRQKASFWAARDPPKKWSLRLRRLANVSNSVWIACVLKNATDRKTPKEASFLATVEGAKVTIIH